VPALGVRPAEVRWISDDKDVHGMPDGQNDEC
jgi:hypothetical protein